MTTVPARRQVEPECSVDGCAKSAKAVGMCHAHYMRLRRWGSLREEIPVSRNHVNRASPIERLFARREIVDGHWLYTGASMGRGYCQISVAGRKQMVHRVAYELFKGPIPDGCVVDHLCRITNCFNPDCLEAVTGGENVARGTSPQAVATRTGFCKRGHALTEENVYHGSHGRACRVCLRERREAKR